MAYRHPFAFLFALEGIALHRAVAGETGAAPTGARMVEALGAWDRGATGHRRRPGTLDKLPPAALAVGEVPLPEGLRRRRDPRTRPCAYPVARRAPRHLGHPPGMVLLRRHHLHHRRSR